MSAIEAVVGRIIEERGGGNVSPACIHFVQRLLEKYVAEVLGQSHEKKEVVLNSSKVLGIEDSLKAVQKESQVHEEMVGNLKFICSMDKVVGKEMERYFRDSEIWIHPNKRIDYYLMDTLGVRLDPDSLRESSKSFEEYKTFIQSHETKESLEKWVGLLSFGAGVHFANDPNSPCNEEFTKVLCFFCWALLQQHIEAALRSKYRGFYCLIKDKNSIHWNERIKRFHASPLQISHFNDASSELMHSSV